MIFAGLCDSALVAPLAAAALAIGALAPAVIVIGLGQNILQLLGLAVRPAPPRRAAHPRRNAAAATSCITSQPRGPNREPRQ